jgi:hypothetical protein
MQLWTVANNRTRGWPDEKLEPLPLSVLHGLVMQTRDDIGEMNNLIIVTNALLAGILAALVAQFLL